jgi:hypothetical protein
MYLSDIYTVSANLAGAPAVSVPCGLSSEGLPIGTQLIGNFWSEATLLNLANVYENQFPLGAKPLIYAEWLYPGSWSAWLSAFSLDAGPCGVLSFVAGGEGARWRASSWGPPLAKRLHDTAFNASTEPPTAQNSWKNIF